jgi:hypothetical protein
MKTRKAQTTTPRLTLPSTVLAHLAKVGIRCTTDVSLEYQKVAGRYVLRGRESGGAAKLSDPDGSPTSLGRYVSFCAEDGQRLPWFIRPDSLTPNSDHAIVIAPALVSIEMFRVGHTYDLLIARHTISEGENSQQPSVVQITARKQGKRPGVVSQVLFRAWQGQLPLDLMSQDKSLSGIAPEFFDASGEPRQIPGAFVPAVHALTVAVNCPNCRHAHLLIPPAAAMVPGTTPATAAAGSPGGQTLAAVPGKGEDRQGPAGA